MRIACRLCALMLCTILAAYSLAEGTWDKVRYCGGTLQADVDPSDWNNHLTVSPEQIVLEINDGTKVPIPIKSVTGISYGQQAHGRIDAIAKIGVSSAESESVIFGLRKTRLHFIGIEYRSPDGKSSGLLLQGNKDNYRAILKALENATGSSVAVLEKDREYLPEAAEIKPAKEPPATKPADEPKKPAVAVPGNSNSKSKSTRTGTLSITCRPKVASLIVDGVAMGTTPASVKLSPGPHSLAVSLGGYKDWVTSVSIEADKTVSVKAELDKQ